jgi:hypothetical protein
VFLTEVGSIIVYGIIITMIEFSPDGKEPKVEKISSAFKESLQAFVEGTLVIEDIEMQETEKSIIFQMRFRGGGNKIFNLISNFYQENETRVKEFLGVEDFGIILDGDKKEFVAQIALPKNISEEDKQIARNVLEELKQKLLST